MSSTMICKRVLPAASEVIAPTSPLRGDFLVEMHPYSISQGFVGVSSTLLNWTFAR